MQAKTSNNLYGADISHYQTVDWAKVKASKSVGFIYAKASQGTSYTDPQFYNHVQGARSQSIPVGAYHFSEIDKGTSAIEEAQHFLNVISKATLDLMPVLDIETPDNKSIGGDKVVSWIREFESVIKKAGKQLMLYTGSFYIDLNDNFNNAFTDLPLWIANYSTNQPNDVGGWTNWTCFQYSDQGSIPGISGNVDVDVAVSLADLKGFTTVDFNRKVVATTLNAYSIPSSNAPVQFTLKQNQVIHISKLTPDRAWAYTTYSNGGWVSTKDLGTI